MRTDGHSCKRKDYSRFQFRFQRRFHANIIAQRKIDYTVFQVVVNRDMS